MDTFSIVILMLNTSAATGVRCGCLWVQSYDSCGSRSSLRGRGFKPCPREEERYSKNYWNTHDGNERQKWVGPYFERGRTEQCCEQVEDWNP